MGSRNHFRISAAKENCKTGHGSVRSSRSSWSTTLSSAVSNKSSISCPSTANSNKSKSLKGGHLLEWYIPRYVIDDKNGACEPFTSAHVKSGTAKKFAHSKSRKTNDNNKENDQERSVPSPLHDDSKQEWLSRHTEMFHKDDQVRSLPLPPAHKPKILQYSPSHANNLSGMFEKALAENYWLPKWYNGFPMIQLPPIVPPASYKPAAGGVVQPDRPWSSFYNAWSSRPTDPYNRYDDRILPPPPQSMFGFAGGPQRRHFSVAPDWRRIRHN